MKKGLLGIVLGGISVGWLFSTGVLAGSEHSSPKMSNVDPKLEDLSFFARDWQCELKEEPSLNASKVSTFQWSVTRDLNDFWFIGQAMTPDGKVFERETLGYNTVMEKFGRTIIGDDGKFANFLSSGWEDDTLTWNGRVTNMATKKVEKSQIVIKKMADDTFRALDYVPLEKDPALFGLVSTTTCSVLTP